MQTPGKPEIVRFNQAAQDDWSEIQSRERDLGARLGRVRSEIELIKANLAFLVVERCAIEDDCKRLAELRLEAEAIQLGIDALHDKAEILRRSNAWLDD